MTQEEAKKLARAKLIERKPEMAMVFAMQDLADKTQQMDSKLNKLDTLDEVVSELKNANEKKITLDGVETIKGEKGDKGDSGETPVKGVDYFTDQEVEEMKDEIRGKATPIKGVHYFDGKDGKSIKGEDGIGKDGKDGSPDSPEQIAEKLNSLEAVLDIKVIKGLEFPANLSVKELVAQMKKLPLEERLDISDIKNWNQPSRGKLDQRWHGGAPTLVAGTNITITNNQNGSKTISASASGTPLQEVPTGTINGINVTFTLSQKPLANTLLLVRGGVTMFTLTGDYTILNKTITMAIAPPSGVTLVASYNY